MLSRLQRQSMGINRKVQNKNDVTTMQSKVIPINEIVVNTQFILIFNAIDIVSHFRRGYLEHQGW